MVGHTILGSSYYEAGRLRGVIGVRCFPKARKSFLWGLLLRVSFQMLLGHTWRI
jgi:hypothetical protein